MRTDDGRVINVRHVGAKLITLLRHDPDRQIRRRMDTTGRAPRPTKISGSWWKWRTSPSADSSWLG
eukprot:6524740-Alexandrium_andersonii.AAC.1